MLFSLLSFSFHLPVIFPVQFHFSLLGFFGACVCLVYWRFRLQNEIISWLQLTFPWHAMAGWICYAEKTLGSYILPHISSVKSPQQTIGAAIKKHLCHELCIRWYIISIIVMHMYLYRWWLHLLLSVALFLSYTVMLMGWA